MMTNETPDQQSTRRAQELDYMDVREVSDGSFRDRSPSYGGAFLGAVLLIFMALPLLLSYCSKTHAAEQGPAGNEIPSSCRSHDRAMAYVTSQYSEDLWRMKTDAFFPSGKRAGLVEWMENRETGTWTLLLSRNGLTCILFSGGLQGAPL